jgi:natural product biosynthesis luciferase-like monooxygenase protein
MTDKPEIEHLEGIAVVGMAGRFPGAPTLEKFWTNLRDGVESVSFFSDDELKAAGVAPALLRDPDYVKAKAILDDVPGFDAGFFGFTPREAEITDPQHRLFLECAWEALEHAGYDPKRFSGPIGLYAGAGINTYLLRNLISNRELIDKVSAFKTSIHNKTDHLTTRVAYLLDLRGPSVTVQTACSTSLVAVTLACQSLLGYQCDMALAGGVTISLPQKSGYSFQEGGIGSPDGHCRAFDAKAAGTVDGNGAGVVVLKRLEEALRDGDTIHAVIRGAAINNDGSHKAGYTAPAVDSQSEVIAMAQALAAVDPESISYVEAHGTATPLGDPIEIAALTKAFRLGTSRSGFCGIGSVKTNIGHLDAAAGVAGLIKTVLALEHGLIPPSLHFEAPNPKIDFSSTPFYVNSKATAWERGANPRRAGVSSFGIGGTNAHVVLEEAPPAVASKSDKPWHLLLVSANTSSALETAFDNLAGFLESHPEVELGDVAYTLQVGRAVFDHRRAVLCRDREEAIQSIRTLDYERVSSRFQETVHRPITFMFPGQGSQYAGMGLDLYRYEPVFRRHVDRCAELLQEPLGEDLRDLLEQDSKLDQTLFTQPALFVIEYALAQLWMSWGLKPTAMIGHSIGEYVAATLAGVITVEDALSLVAFRGKLMQSLPRGSMLAVTLPEKDVVALLNEDLSLAAVNGPSLCVVSGAGEAVVKLEKKLTAQGVITRRLNVSHAFHSHLMEPICEAFNERCRQIDFRSPEIPYLSNLTGTWIKASEATDPNYWTMHLRQPVRFAAGVAELLTQPEMVLLEVGPGHTLKTVSRWHPLKAPDQVVETSLPHRGGQQSEFAFLLSSVGKLWLAGVEFDWPAFYASERRRRIPLPTYPFERRRYWIEDKTGATVAQDPTDALSKRQDVAEWFYVPVWKETVPPVFETREFSNQRKNWLLFAADEDPGLAQRLDQLGQRVFTVTAGNGFSRPSEQEFQIDPAQPEDYVRLLETLRKGDAFPDSIVHLWSATPATTQTSEQLQRLGFYSLLHLAQAIGKQTSTSPLRITVVSSGLHEITGAETVCAERALTLGPCRVIPQEFSHVECRSLDVPELAASQSIDQIIAEAASETTNTVVALRRGHKWIQDFQPVRLEAKPETSLLLRSGGVYLLTGGMGGIGLALSEFLAHTLQAKLVLCSRSQFPVRESWDQWLATHSERDATSVRIRTLQKLEAAGAELMIAAADVANEDQMRELMQHAIQRFGKIDGVIHAAGVAGGGLIQLRTIAEVERVLAPKVKGARILESFCADLNLDFLVLCSSLSSLAGGPGQVDYSAANAFLDAFAREQQQRNGPLTISINWGQWQSVGMAAGDLRKTAEATPEIRKLDHPLLERCVIKASGEEIYSTEFNAHKHWVLDEHRLVGNAVIPGVAYFEMIRAALGERANNRTIELQDVLFVGPLHVRDDQTREVRLILQPSKEGFDFSVESDALNDETGAVVTRTYALGKVRLSDLVPARHYNLDELIAGCNSRQEIFADEEREDDLGPRWQNVKQAYVGSHEVLTALELPADYARDFTAMKYHPALMDRAVGRAKEYLFAGEYLPVSYKSLKIHRPIPNRIYSYAVYQQNDEKVRETLTWETVVLDPDGLLLVEIEGFVQKRINDAATTIKSYASADDHSRAEAEPAGAREEMSVAEGVESFRRIMVHPTVPQVAVSVRDLKAAIEQRDVIIQERLQEETGRQRAPQRSHPRPNLRTRHVAPRNESEVKLAALWAEALGIEQVGVDDNFFELGGDSVQAILIIAALNKAGYTLTPQQFFQYQTIAELSELLSASDLTLTSAPAEMPATDFPLANLDSDEFGKLSLLIDEADDASTTEQELVAYVVNDSKDNGHEPPCEIEFSLFYFAEDKQDSSRDKYRLFIEGAKFADANGFAAVWTPERHFHSSGGLYPSPSVLSAALATITSNVRLCAGSVVLPLHHPLRVAEEWAVVDNLSQGRVGVSFTSGWIPNDFVFFPERYSRKRSAMFEGIEHVKRLWRGESVPVKDGAGNNVVVRIFPLPIQPELPVWLTCSGDPEMFVKAGELGVNVLTALLTQSVEETATKIALYREARAKHGHDPASGRVTLMVHTFVGDDEKALLGQVRAPLCNYLKSHIGLVETMVAGLNLKTELSGNEYLDDLVSFAFERYYQTASLIGTHDKCLQMIERFRAIGVDEVACFIDFGVDTEAALSSLPHLNAVKHAALMSQKSEIIPGHSQYRER